MVSKSFILIFSMGIMCTVSLSSEVNVGGSVLQTRIFPKRPMEPLVEMKFRNIGGYVVIPVRVKASRELSMILDTGMSAPIVMLFHRELKEELDLTEGQPVTIAGAGDRGQQSGTIVSGVNITFGSLEQENQTIIVMDESRDASPWTLDGVIGKSIFDKYAVSIDYEADILRLYDPSAFDAPESNALPLSLRRGIPVVEAAIQLEEGKDIPVRSYT